MYPPLPAFAAVTGLRPEEWAALERRHVDRSRRVVRVEQALDGPGRIRPGGKTPNSVRGVRLSGLGLVALEELPLRIDTPLLFAERGPLNLDNFRRRDWSPAI